MHPYTQSFATRAVQFWLNAHGVVYLMGDGG